MYSKKDDNENKGRKSGKGPKLSKGMKKAARKEKKAVKKQGKQLKKGVKKVAKEIGKVTRFVGSQPAIGKIAGGSAYATGFKARQEMRAPAPKRVYNLSEKIKPIPPMPKAISPKVKKKEELTRGQKRSYELRDAHS